MFFVCFLILCDFFFVIMNYVLILHWFSLEEINLDKSIIIMPCDSTLSESGNLTGLKTYSPKQNITIQNQEQQQCESGHFSKPLLAPFTSD